MYVPSHTPTTTIPKRTALPRQVQLGADAHGDEHDARGDPGAVRELHLLGLRVVGLDPHARADLDAVGAQLPGDAAAEAAVHRGHHRGEELDHGGAEPALGEGLGHLQPHEAAAHHHGGRRRVRLDVAVDAVHVPHLRECMYMCA